MSFLSCLTTLLLLYCHLSLAREDCFFNSALTCPNYCCRSSGSFTEYCCDDCSKSRSMSCLSENMGLIIGITFGVIVLIGIIGTIIALCVCGCICAGLTGRQPYRGGRVIRRPGQQQTVVATTVGPGPVVQTQQTYYQPQAQGGYPPAQGGYPPAQGGYPPAQGGYPPAPGQAPYPVANQGGYGAPPPYNPGGFSQAPAAYPPPSNEKY